MNHVEADNTQPDYIWNIVPLHPPLIHRNCAKCEKARTFYCSEKFRINAQQKNVDVWLIYNCTVCDTTWNCSILRQVSPKSIDPEIYNKFQLNDKSTSWEYAFDYGLLKRNGAVPDLNIEYIIEGEDINLAETSKERISILIKLKYRLDPRLDALLSNKLHLSRKKLESLYLNGGLVIYSESIRNINKKLKGDTLILLSVKDVPALEARSERDKAPPGT